MNTRTSHGIEVDICPTCRGLWLDAGEFDPLVAERFAGEPLEAFFALTAEEASDQRAAPCPVDGADMSLVRFDDLELDWCPTCHGMWIDGYERDALAAGQTRAPDDPEQMAQGESSGRADTFEMSEEPNQRASASRRAEIEAPGLVELEPEGPLHSDLEVDFSVVQADADREIVHCASCTDEVERGRAMRRMDAYWCEVCVVKGDFPGSNGPPVSQRMAEAALAMSKARVQLDQKKSSIKEMKESRARVRRGINRHNDLHVANAVHATAKAVWNMFKPDK